MRFLLAIALFIMAAAVVSTIAASLALVGILAIPIYPG